MILSPLFFSCRLYPPKGRDEAIPASSELKERRSHRRDQARTRRSPQDDPNQMNAACQIDDFRPSPVSHFFDVRPSGVLPAE
jgi:hypothetical protein